MSDLSLDNVVTNDMNFKHLETTKDITISIKNENGFPQPPDATHTWTAKVSDGTNYVGDYAVTINQTSLIVDSENFTKLPTGSYQLEVWEEWNDPDGTKQRSIYPSPSQTIPFTIYANLTDQAEKEIKSIGFQDVVDQAVMNIGMNYVFKVNTIEPDQTATVVQAAADGKNYVTFNIPRGAKGDQGNVGPAPTLKIGTVTKLNSDQTPTANVSGDNGSYTLDLGIPQGSKGDPGDNGLYHYAVDLTDAKFDRNKWYYVEADSYKFGSLGGPSYFSLEVSLDKQNVPYGTYLAANGSGGICARQTVLFGQGQWGSYTRKLIVLDDQNPSWFSTDGKRLLTFAIPSDNNLKYAFYARGGLKINVTSDVPGLTWTPHTDTLVENGTTIPVLNDAPDPKALGLADDTTFWALPMSQLKQQLSNDSQLVHTTSNETIAGDKALVGNTTLATTTILAGNYGLRVTSSGFQKTTDGITWVSANI